MKKINTAVILCGGKGSRLGTLGKKIPKALVKVQGKEILWYILKVLKKNKFNHVILPIGFTACDTGFGNVGEINKT